jgi:hypothetical protein
VEPPDSTTSWVGSIRSSRLGPVKPSWKLRIARWLGLCAIAAFTVLGVAYNERSMDLPWTGDSRYGFYGNGLPTHWICDDGHDHYSLPFWMGALVCAIPTALWWFVWPRRPRS